MEQALAEPENASPVIHGGGSDSPPDPSQIFSRRRQDFEHIEIRDYDFKRPERISKEQMRSLHTLHDNFARNYGASLSGLLQTIVEVRVTHTEQITYSEFIAGLPNPTCFNLISIPQLEGQICLELSPLVVYPIIDRLLGGSSSELSVPQREMTQIEVRLMRSIVNRALPVFTEAWEKVRELHFELDAMEANPQIVQIVPPNEVVAVIGLEIKLGQRAGTMSLSIPFQVIEPLMEELSAQRWALAGHPHAEDHWERMIKSQLNGAPVPLTGILAETTLSMSQLRQLEVGDIITTDKPATSPVKLAVTGRNKFLASIGQYKGSRALRIIRPLQGADQEDWPDAEATGFPAAPTRSD